MRLCSITPCPGDQPILRLYETDHSAASGIKSSAVTAPPDTSFNFAANSHEGSIKPRRMRLMVVRSTFTSEATRSSVSPPDSIHSLIFMEGNVRQTHNSCQVPCACGVVDYGTSVRTMHSMAKSSKRSTKKTKKPKWGRHYILAWREGCEVGQEELAYLMGYKSHSTVQRVEVGTSGYTESFLGRAAHVFICRPGDLLNGPPSQEQINAFKASRRSIAS